MKTVAKDTLWPILAQSYSVRSKKSTHVKHFWKIKAEGHKKRSSSAKKLSCQFFNYKINAEVLVLIRPAILGIFAWNWLHRVFGFTVVFGMRCYDNILWEPVMANGHTQKFCHFKLHTHKSNIKHGHRCPGTSFPLPSAKVKTDALMCRGAHWVACLVQMGKRSTRKFPVAIV